LQRKQLRTWLALKIKNSDAGGTAAVPKSKDHASEHSAGRDIRKLPVRILQLQIARVKHDSTKHNSSSLPGCHGLEKHFQTHCLAQLVPKALGHIACNHWKQQPAHLRSDMIWRRSLWHARLHHVPLVALCLQL
jgi:hypothetical protein